MKISKRSVVVFSSFVVLGLSSVYIYKRFDSNNKEHSEEFEGNFNDNNLNKTVVFPTEIATISTSPDFKLIDSLVRRSPKEKLKTIDDLANYLSSFCKTDLEKSRAIYIWLTHYVRYDDDGYNNDLLKRNYSAKEVFDSKVAVCEGFSNLFLALGIKMNIEIQKVVGYAKGYGYTKGNIFKDSDHAWNMIKINNEWLIFDATWGEGYGETINNKLVSTKKFTENWFNVSPYIAIYSHYPENIELLNCKPIITLKEYEVFPKIDLSYFNFGFDPVSTYTNVCNNRALEFPECYNTKTKIKLINTPQYKNIKLYKKINVEVYAPNVISIAIIDQKNDWTYLKNKNNVFKVNYLPKSIGKLKLAIKYDSVKTSYEYFMIYQVLK